MARGELGRRRDVAAERRRGRGSPEPGLEDTRVGMSPVPWWMIALTALFFIALSALLVYSLWQFWPASVAEGEAADGSRYTFLWWTIGLSQEKNLLIVVAVAGALGAMAHVLRSFLRYVGERRLLYSWLLSYYVTPMVGVILATVAYVVLRAGLVGTGIDQTNPFGFAAVGLLVGLFSAQAALKLKQVFEAIFAPTTPGKDAVADGAAGERNSDEEK